MDSSRRSEPDEIGLRVHGVIDALRIAPGDAIVVQLHRRITTQQAEQIQAQFKAILPDNKVLLLSPDMTIASTEVVA